MTLLWVDSASHLCRYRWTHLPGAFVGKFWECGGAVHASRALCWCHHLSDCWWGEPPEGDPEALLCQAEDKTLRGKWQFCAPTELGKVCDILADVCLNRCGNTLAGNRMSAESVHLLLTQHLLLVVLWQFHVAHIEYLYSLILFLCNGLCLSSPCL